MNSEIFSLSLEEKEYVLNLPFHLHAGDMTDELCKLLTEFDFINYKINAGKIQLIIDDYDLILKGSNHSDDKSEFRIIQETIQLSAHILAEDKSQLSDQLQNRLIGTIHPTILSFLEQIDQIDQQKNNPRLRLLTPSITTYGSQLIRTLADHKGYINAVEITPDGSHIISASDDHTLKVWDFKTGEMLKTLRGHTDKVNAVRIVPSGKQIISGSSDKTVKIWNWNEGSILHTLNGHTEPVLAVTLTLDGKHIISCSRDKTLKVWDLRSGTLLQSLIGHTDFVNSAVVTPDGNRVISASRDGTLKLWDFRTGGEISTVKDNDYGSEIFFVDISQDGNMLVSASDDTLKIWSITSKLSSINILKDHTGNVYTGIFTQDGNRIISGSGDRSIKIWNILGEVFFTLNDHAAPILCLAITPDNQHIVSGSMDERLKIWKLPNHPQNHLDRRSTKLEQRHTERVSALGITSNGQQVVSASFDKTIKIWDVENGTLLSILEGHSAGVTGIAIIINGRCAVSTSIDSDIRIWNLKTEKTVKIIRGREGISQLIFQILNLPFIHRLGDWVSQLIHFPEDMIFLSAITPNEEWIFTVTLNKVIKVHSIQNGFFPKSKQVFNHIIRVIIAWINKDKESFVHIGKSPSKLIKQGVNKTTINAISITPDGYTLISGMADGSIKFWCIKTGLKLFELKNHIGSVQTIIATSDGNYIISGSDDKTLKVWDLRSRENLYTLQSHTAPVKSVAISPNNRYIVSASEDNTIRVWDWKRQEEIAKFVGESAMQSCTFTPDGLMVVAGEDSGRLHFLRLKGLDKLEK